MPTHLRQLIFIHALIEIDRRPTVNIRTSLPKVDDSCLILSLGSDLSLVVAVSCYQIRLNQSLFECLYVNRAVFEAVRPLYKVGHLPPLGLAPFIKKLFHNLLVLGALIGVHHVFGSGGQGLKNVPAIGNSVLFCAGL